MIKKDSYFTQCWFYTKTWARIQEESERLTRIEEEKLKSKYPDHTFDFTIEKYFIDEEN